MMAKSNALQHLTAVELMTPVVVRLPAEMPMREAARLLLLNQISVAPVVDVQGKCIGTVSVNDFVRWIEEGPFPTCPYQVRGRLLTGEEAVICTLTEGSCPLQEIRPTVEGRHTAVCPQPFGAGNVWQRVADLLPSTALHRHLTANVSTIGTTIPLPEMARTMIDNNLQYLVVVDDAGKPIGIVSNMDLLAALIRSEEDC
jgi:CBS-domain-containing membrane protein